MKIAIISDTHSYIDDRILHHIKNCDEVWHAGDVGNPSVIDAIKKVCKLRCVYGNIDDQRIRTDWNEIETFNAAGLRILMIHIAGSVGKYNQKTRALISDFRPDILVCGHSHILKIQRDEQFNLLHINPGAAGNHGFHRVRTICRFEIIDGKPRNLQVIELGSRSTQSID